MKNIHNLNNKILLNIIIIFNKYILTFIQYVDLIFDKKHTKKNLPYSKIFHRYPGRCHFHFLKILLNFEYTWRTSKEYSILLGNYQNFYYTYRTSSTSPELQLSYSVIFYYLFWNIFPRNILNYIFIYIINSFIKNNVLKAFKKIIIIKNFPENQNYDIYKRYIQFKIFIQFFHKRKKN